MLTYKIVICTRNNSKKLSESIEKIVEHALHPSIVIINQDKQLADFKSSHILVIHTLIKKGVSKSRNLAIRLLKKTVIIWLDDDSIVTSNFITEIEKLRHFKRENKCGGIFGETLPYQQQKHPNEYCPSVFRIKKTHTARTIINHGTDIGFSNNMIIFPEIFKEIGGFKNWLGGGSIGRAAEDAEFIIRSLIAGYYFIQNKKMLTYHNKWLHGQKRRKQDRDYICGGVAAYSFYTFQGVQECKKPLKEHFAWSVGNIKADLRSINYKKPWEWKNNIISIILELKALLHGIFIGFVYAKIVPIPEKENVVKRFYMRKKISK